MVKVGFFLLVKVVFLIKGNTKNDCDQMSNLLKLDYRLYISYAVEQVVEHLHENHHVRVELMQLAYFYDWKKTLDNYHLKMESGEKNSPYIFTIYSSEYGKEPMMVHKQDDVNVEGRIHSLLLTKKNKKAKYMEAEERKQWTKDMLDKLELCNPLGLSNIKQCKLYNSWRKIIPPKYQDITCLKPLKEFLNRIKKECDSKILKEKGKKKRKIVI